MDLRHQHISEALALTANRIDLKDGAVVIESAKRKAGVHRFIEDLQGLSLHVEPPLSPIFWPGVLELAEQYRLTAYDAAYVELAQRTGLPLATLDEALQTAANKTGVRLL